MTQSSQVHRAAALLGGIRTPKKAASSRRNGRKPVGPGRRPRGRPRKPPVTPNTTTTDTTTTTDRRAS